MEEKFKEIAARYCSLEASEITNDMSLRSDLGLSSLDTMTLLGDLEDEFDVDFEFTDDDQRVAGINTVGDAIELLREYVD
ncbi:acyl carrier protein [Ruminococcaceae bacterium FB2012]|nr:acyl carrier protein [Ruminococcaceae bacterium FB2012]